MAQGVDQLSTPVGANQEHQMLPVRQRVMSRSHASVPPVTNAAQGRGRPEADQLGRNACGASPQQHGVSIIRLLEARPRRESGYSSSGQKYCMQAAGAAVSDI